MPLKRRGGRAIHKMDPFRNGAAGVVSSAKLFRPEVLAELTTINASRYRARASRPSAALLWLRNFLLMPQPPLLFQGGECARVQIYSHLHRPRLQFKSPLPN